MKTIVALSQISDFSVTNVPRLRELIPAQEQKSEKLLSSCNDWFGSPGRTFVLLTNAPKKNSNPPISQLLCDDTVLHIPTKLFGANRTIMDKIIGKMSEGSS